MLVRNGDELTSPDWKCTIRLLDKSTESSQEESIGVHLFREESCMPKVQLGDIVVVIQAKVNSDYMLYALRVQTLTASAGSMP